MAKLTPCRAWEPCLRNHGVWIMGHTLVVCPWCNGYRPIGPSNDSNEARGELIAIEWSESDEQIDDDKPCEFGDEICEVCQYRHLAAVIRDHEPSLHDELEVAATRLL